MRRYEMSFEQQFWLTRLYFLVLTQKVKLLLTNNMLFTLNLLTLRVIII